MHTAPRSNPPQYPRPETEPASEQARELGRALRQATVGDLMTYGALCLHADSPISDAADALLELKIGAMPVVDDGEPPVGVIELRDVLEHYHAHDTASVLARRTVRDIMHPVSIAFEPEFPADFAAAVIAYQHVNHVPVVTHEGKLCGMLASEDVLRWVSWASGFVMPDMVDRTADRLRHAH